MRVQDIAVTLLMRNSKFNTAEAALDGLRTEFKIHFPTWNYDQWNSEVPENLAKNIINNVGKNGNVSVRFIIKDLDTILKAL
jgi:hypothetical protein